MGLSERVNELSHICKSRTKNLLESEDVGDDDGFTKQFSEGKWLDDEKSTWLSLGSSSPSSCFSFRVEDCLPSFESLSLEFFSSKEVTLFDGSRVSPIEEALLVLDKMQSKDDIVLQEDLKEDEIVTWLITSTRDDLSDSSITSSEISDSFCSQSFEDSSTSDDSLSQFSIDLDSPHSTRDVERSQLSIDLDSPLSTRDVESLSVSLINLDGEDSNWILDTQSEIDLIHSDFPSPSYKRSWNFEIHSCGSSTSRAIEMKNPKSKYRTTFCYDHLSEAFDLEDFSADTPLFWPPSTVSDWSSDVTCDYFIMSPRKYNHRLSNSDVSSSGSFRFRVHHGRKMEAEKVSRRRLIFGSGSKSSNFLDFNRKSGIADVRRISTMPSRFSKSRKNQTNASHEGKADILKVNKIGLLNKSLLKEDFVSNMEVSIEKILGLDEFDGHEGVESEFDKDDFSLDEV